MLLSLGISPWDVLLGSREHTMLEKKGGRGYLSMEQEDKPRVCRKYTPSTMTPPSYWEDAAFTPSSCSQRWKVAKAHVLRFQMSLTNAKVGALESASWARSTRKIVRQVSANAQKLTIRPIP